MAYAALRPIFSTSTCTVEVDGQIKTFAMLCSLANLARLSLEVSAGASIQIAKNMSYCYLLNDRNSKIIFYLIGKSGHKWCNCG
jgi:hypothetical protein